MNGTKSIKSMALASAVAIGHLLAAGSTEARASGVSHGGVSHGGAYCGSSYHGGCYPGGCYPGGYYHGGYYPGGGYSPYPYPGSHPGGWFPLQSGYSGLRR